MTTRAVHTDPHPSDYKAEPLTEQTARELSEKIRDVFSMENVTMIYRAHALKIWQPLGIKDWAGWCAQYLPIGISKPTVKQRRAIVADWRASNPEVSTYAMAEALGVDQSIIVKDLGAIRKANEDNGDGQTPLTTTPPPVKSLAELLTPVNTKLMAALDTADLSKASDTDVKALRRMRDEIDGALDAISTAKEIAPPDVKSDESESDETSVRRARKRAPRKATTPNAQPAVQAA